MRTITVNRVSFPWKLTLKRSKELGIKGPGHGDSAVKALQAFNDDWDAAIEFVLAGCLAEDKERMRREMEDWDREDFEAFLAQAFGSKTPATAEPPIQ